MRMNLPRYMLDGLYDAGRHLKEVDIVTGISHPFQRG